MTMTYELFGQQFERVIKPDGKAILLTEANMNSSSEQIVLYFDTEFTGLHKDTDLISIGIVSAYNEVFYAEITDYDNNKVDDWCNENVVKNLRLKSSFGGNDGYHQFIKGTKQEVSDALNRWLLRIYNAHKAYNNPYIQFVSDVCHYDYVLLIDLLSKNALDLPDYINASCHDINQDISVCFNVSEKDAFNLNREEITLSLLPSYTPYTMVTVNNDMIRKLIEDSSIKHNALWDAYIIMMISRMMQNRPWTPINTVIFNDLNKNQSVGD